MAELEKHHEQRKNKIVKQYHADQDSFLETLTCVSARALERHYTSPKLIDSHFAVQKQHAKRLVESGLSWYFKLHLPASTEEASRTPSKALANRESREETISHEYHTRQLKKIQKILKKCRNLSESGMIASSDDAFCRNNFPDDDLEEVFTEQRTYLFERKARLRRGTAQTDAEHIGLWKGNLVYAFTETGFCGAHEDDCPAWGKF